MCLTLTAPQTAVLFYSLFPKHLGPLVFREANLRLVLLSLGCLVNKPSVCCKPRHLSVLVAAHQTKPSWFSNTRTSELHKWVLVLWPGVTPETQRWESQVQDIGPPETSGPHVISIGDSSPESSVPRLRPSSTQRPASSSAGHPMPNN